MKNYALAGIAVLATSVAAHAAIVTETGSFSGTVGGANIVIQDVQKFNGTLGTLTSIKLEVTATTANTSLTFDNEGAGSGSATIKLDSQIQGHTGVNVNSNFFANSSLSKTGIVAADNDAAPNFSGTDSLLLTGGVLATGSVTQTTAPYLTQFTAAGADNNYPVTISSRFTNSTPLLSASAPNVSGVFNTPSQTFTGSYKVTYTYTPLAAVPEAGTLLFGAAMCVALAFRRQRQNAI